MCSFQLELYPTYVLIDPTFEKAGAATSTPLAKAAVAVVAEAGTRPPFGVASQLLDAVHSFPTPKYGVSLAQAGFWRRVGRRQHRKKEKGRPADRKQSQNPSTRTLPHRRDGSGKGRKVEDRRKKRDQRKRF